MVFLLHIVFSHGAVCGLIASCFKTLAHVFFKSPIDWSNDIHWSVKRSAGQEDSYLLVRMYLSKAKTYLEKQHGKYLILIVLSFSKTYKLLQNERKRHYLYFLCWHHVATWLSPAMSLDSWYLSPSIPAPSFQLYWLGLESKPPLAESSISETKAFP